MPGDFTPASLQLCLLFKRLNKPFKTPRDNELAKMFAATLPDICKIASDRMKFMPAIHPQFTLHDETHLLRVVELMALVLPEVILNEVLNPIEITLLILSAFFHDVGMVPDAETTKLIRSSREYALARDNWIVEYPNFKEALLFTSQKESADSDREGYITLISQHEQAIFERFVRENHAKASAKFVLEKLGGDDRLRVGTGHLADSLSLLCASHNWRAEDLTEANGFYTDKAIGSHSTNLLYLACILRLADLLDFDRERTPDELYRSIAFSNPVSIHEWEKHRAVSGWKIDRDAVRFECAFESPEYERAAHKFMGFIDDELTAVHALIKRMPTGSEQFNIDLPYRTDRSRMRPKDGAYIFASDLEISLSRDEIIRLLMTEKLYGHPSLAIRELLQNSWDALRHRSAIFKRDEQMEWTNGKVLFEHGVNPEGREFVRCQDNGVGMDQHILSRFLVKAGRSYYRSPEFERERISFRQKGADFDPCAKFGIGFMSVFMLGEKIVITTRRYLGTHGGMGEPLVAEINGTGSLIVLRRGKDDQPIGTTIEIIGRKKPDRFLTHHDRVKLIETIYAYALAGEFPVSATCSIKEIEDQIEIPAGIAKPWHPFREFGVKKCEFFEQQFHEIDSRMHGSILCGVPVSDEGHLVVLNDEAGWKATDNGRGSSLWVRGSQHDGYMTWEGRTCLDGILVAGPQGRGRSGWTLVGMQYRNPISFGEDLFVLDVRADLKPELTPHRSPPDSRSILHDAGPGWRKLRRKAAQAHGKMWEKVITKFDRPEDARALWQLLALHHVSFNTLTRSVIWNLILVPSYDGNGNFILRRFSDLEPIPFGPSNENGFTADAHGIRITLDKDMSAWTDINKRPLVERTLMGAILSMATLELKDGAPFLAFHPPTNQEEFAFHDLELDNFQHRFVAIPFGDGFHDILAASTAQRLLNRTHPVVAKLHTWHSGTFDDPDFAFLYALSDALLAENAIEVLAKGQFKNKQLNHYFAMLGYRFSKLDINLLPLELRPPYYCWHPEYGRIEITEHLLEKLSELQAIDWHRRQEPRYI